MFERTYREGPYVSDKVNHHFSDGDYPLIAYYLDESNLEGKRIIINNSEELREFKREVIPACFGHWEKG